MLNSIITPVFNRSDLTVEFIRAVAPLLGEYDELIIIDNASTDNTETAVKMLSLNYPKSNIIYHKNDTNVGFGNGNNVGVSISRGENLIFISNDVNVYGDFIRPIQMYLREHPNDAVGARCITFETGWNNIWNEIALIPYLEGWNIALKKRNFEMVGGFDPNIFIDYEDIMLSFQLHMAGIGLAQLALPIFHPMPGSSFKGLSEERIKYTMRSIEYFGNKWGFTRK
jgi:N-acetylglucosaminyl-diphospho-decaprenol L-rhamnosyltransferase